MYLSVPKLYNEDVTFNAYPLTQRFLLETFLGLFKTAIFTIIYILDVKIIRILSYVLVLTYKSIKTLVDEHKPIIAKKIISEFKILLIAKKALM